MRRRSLGTALDFKWYTMYIVHIMNKKPTVKKTVSPRLKSQAGTLSSLTRDLTQCCAAKEAEIFRRWGITASEGYLLLEVANAGSLAPSIAARRLGWTRSRLTPLARSLVEKGFLAESASLEDHRSHPLLVTRTGFNVARDAHEYRERFHARLLQGFTGPERKRVLEALGRLRDRIEQVRTEMRLIG
jgi:DNA-binding MarR family transcriptional regulator